MKVQDNQKRVQFHFSNLRQSKDQRLLQHTRRIPPPPHNLTTYHCTHNLFSHSISTFYDTSLHSQPSSGYIHTPGCPLLPIVLTSFAVTPIPAFLSSYFFFEAAHSIHPLASIMAKVAKPKATTKADTKPRSTRKAAKASPSDSEPEMPKTSTKSKAATKTRGDGKKKKGMQE